MTIIGMKTRELREKSPEELRKLLFEDKAKLVELRFDVSAHQEKNVKEINRIKKEIARINTILKEKEGSKKGAEKSN